jgi:predicted GNAT family acetyltransferase
MTDEMLVLGQIPTVRNDPAHDRYVIAVSGGVVLGHIDYHDLGHVVSLRRTVISPEYVGVQGLSNRLVHGALAEIRARGQKMLPYCPVVRDVVTRERDRFEDLVPEKNRADFGLV